MNKFKAISFLYIFTSISGCITNKIDTSIVTKPFLEVDAISLIKTTPPTNKLGNDRKKFSIKLCDSGHIKIINRLLDKAHKTTKADYFFNVKIFHESSIVKEIRKNCSILEGYYFLKKEIKIDETMK